MTKEQIKKHGNVIKWFCENPDKYVCYRGATRWHYTDNPLFYTDTIYVQDDEWTEYRKALADGKQLQYKTTHSNGKTQLIDIVGLNPTDEFDYEIDYHIKEDNQEFNVGDWVQIDSDVVLIKGSMDLIDLHYLKNAKKWKPKFGELCVFWDNNEFGDTPLHYYIAKFNNTKCEHAPDRYEFYDVNGNIWDNVAPLEFIEALKDK